MTRLYCDTETFSPIPIKHGSYKYAEKAEVMLWAYAFDDEPVKLWDRTSTKTMPADLSRALADPNIMTVWHNGGGFDRVVVKASLGIKIPVRRIHDTMARAFSHGFPGGLDVLCTVMNVPVSKAKDKDGKKLINLFCMPRPVNQKLRRATKETHPEEWAKFCRYATLDIEAMRYIDQKMPLWNYSGYELRLWFRDQNINSRGCCVDTELANAAIRAVRRAQEGLSAQTTELTDGAVRSTTQRDELLKHILAEYGVDLPDMQASTLEHRMEDPNLPPEVKQLLAIRLQASSTSTAKYLKFINNVNSDGRLRGTLQFSGAQRTKRWAGRGVQLHNLANPTMSRADINFGIRAMKADCEDLFFDNVMELAKNALRGCIIASPEQKLFISDLANIEGRDAAWIAGEKWKLDAFKLYDTFQLDAIGEKIPDGKGGFLRKGPDLYCVAYGRAFHVDPWDVKKWQRQIGKVMELMLQYGGGVGAFVTGALTYDIDLVDMARIVLAELPADVLSEAAGMWEWAIKKKRTLGLPRDIFVACDGLKRLWRRRHPQITEIWPDLEKAARAAIDSPKKIIQCRKLAFEKRGNWLRMILPSGYFLCYPAPRVNNDGEISFMGMNQYSRKWSRIKTYGGKLFENACQACARDVMAWNMERIEERGFKIILSVHDELICEAPDNSDFTVEELSALLATNPAWAQGLPLAAGGFEDYRYRKG